VFIDLERYMTFFSSTTDNDDLLKAIKKYSEELEGIRQVLEAIQLQGEKQK
jgi:hypothetical protein